MLEFVIMISCYVMMISAVIYFKEFKSAFFLVWFGATIALFTPSFYVFFGGVSYRSYGEEAAKNYYLLSAISFIFVFITVLMVKFLQSKVDENVFVERNISNVLFYTLAIIVFVVYIYIFIYWNEWPLINVFKGNFIERPDVVKGAFQGYFTYSVLAQLILPAIFFFYQKSLRSSKVKYIAGFSFFIFPMLAGGNKGILLYFLVFIFLYSPIKIKVSHYILSFSLCLLLYAGIKSVTAVDGITLSYLIESILTRTFVTQGMSAPALLEMFSINNNISTLSSNEMKYRIFEFVYGYSPGSMPVYYTFELYVRYGKAGMIILSLFISIIVALATVLVRTSQSMAMRWCYYYCIYAFVMAGISDANLMRYAFTLCFVIYFILLSKKLNNASFIKYDFTRFSNTLR